MTGISIVAVPISIAWLLNGLWLGQKQEGMAAAEMPGLELVVQRSRFNGRDCPAL
jgi:hypothetical protein